MYELIICEKPAAAQKIALALADGKPKKETYQGVSYYTLTHEGKEIKIGSAVGHLFGLGEKSRTRNFQYPVFEIEWLPSFELSKGSLYVKKYVDCLRKLAKAASTFMIACDYDTEGEVIGLNVVRYICNRNDAKRMKFSTLTTNELQESYKNASKTLDWGQAEAGETRHFLDFFYGINISRALTKALRTTGLFHILSTGRVQGPALKIIVEREKEIKAFIPTPYWEVVLHAQTQKNKREDIDANHAKGKFWEKANAEKVMQNVAEVKEGIVEDIQTQSFKQSPPHPFDLTTLQTEAYKVFGISPKYTSDIAQDLYTQGVISYPRTSSHQLPISIGYSSIISSLGKNPSYKELAKLLLEKKNVAPNNGKKTDPAHPAIYPTGLPAKTKTERHAKIYDLIVKRFFATFGEPATRQTQTITITVNKEPFLAQGSRTTIAGWHIFYAPYVKLDEIELPSLKKADLVTIKGIDMLSKETAPPRRYTPASIIKELEKRNLGTKATRADIIETLYDRQYIAGESIAATELGIHIVDVLSKRIPAILDEELTRNFELDMDGIRERTKKPLDVLKEAQTLLTTSLKKFESFEKPIGEELKNVVQDLRQRLATVGSCPVCKKGTLMIRRGKFGPFVACDSYPDCKTTFKLPKGKILMSEELCTSCNMKKLLIFKRTSKPKSVCINMDCPAKKVSFDQKPCPTCGTGTVVLRKSIYGVFAGCNAFPKCRFVEQIKNASEGTTKHTTQKPQANSATNTLAVEKVSVQKKRKTRSISSLAIKKTKVL